MSVYDTPAFDGTPRNAASHWQESQPQQYAWTRPENGSARVQLQRGDSITSFRGVQWFYEGVETPAQGNSEGRVAVSRECSDSYATGYGGRDCPHIWHHGGQERTSYYPSVFGLYLGTADGSEA